MSVVSEQLSWSDPSVINVSVLFWILGDEYPLEVKIAFFVDVPELCSLEINRYDEFYSILVNNKHCMTFHEILDTILCGPDYVFKDTFCEEYSPDIYDAKCESHTLLIEYAGQENPERKYAELKTRLAQYMYASRMLVNKRKRDKIEEKRACDKAECRKHEAGYAKQAAENARYEAERARRHYDDAILYARSVQFGSKNVEIKRYCASCIKANAAANNARYALKCADNAAFAASAKYTDAAARYANAAARYERIADANREKAPEAVSLPLYRVIKR